MEPSKDDTPNLKTNISDITTSFAKGILGVIPFCGPLFSEAVSILIPNQKIDRVIEFLRILDGKLEDLGLDVQTIADKFKTKEYLDLFEDATVQASRALSEDRKERIASILTKSLSDPEVKYDQSKKLLYILNDLTDSEIIYLKFFSLHGDEQRAFIVKHKDILHPASSSIGAHREELDKKALQDSYKLNLVRFGLLSQGGSSGTTYQMAPLGNLLLRYVEFGSAIS